MQDERYAFRGKRHLLLPILFLLPQLVITVVFFFYPAGEALLGSVYMEDSFGLSREFVGLDNFAVLFSDPSYLETLYLTFIFSIATITLTMTVSLLMAVVADQVHVGGTLYKSMLIIPYAVAPPLAGVLWLFLFNPSVGVLSSLLDSLGYTWNHKLNGNQALLLLIISAAGCSLTELTRQKSGEITLPKETQTVQVETTTNITPQADAWREANLPTEYDLLGCCDFVDWFILLTGSKAPGSSENTGYTAFQAFVVQKDGEDYTLAAWNDTSEWDSSVGFMVHTLVTNDRTVIYGFTTDTVFGVWDQENRHDVSFDEITVTFQDSSIPLTRSIDPGKPFLTFSEGTRSIADISFSDGERTANWSDVSGDGLNEPSEPLDCAPLLSKKSSCTTSLPIPASSMFGLTGREAVLFDAAVAQRYPRSDNDIVLPSLREYGSFEENGKTVVICDLHYDFYYDYTGPDWEWNGGAMNTYLRAELETQDGAEVCTGFEIFPGGSPSDWISGECGPLAMQNADGAWVLPEAAGYWFPAVENPFQQYLEVIASTAASSDAPAADSLSDDMIWEYVHEKLDYAHWAQDMTAEYEDIVRKFQIEDSKMSDLPGDVSQWPRYYSAFVDYFSAANADLRYLDADTIWTKDLSEDRQSLIVTLTRADVILMLSYSPQTSQITEVSTRRNAVLQSVTGDSVTAEHITLLNASLEEDLQTLKALNIPPQNYWYGYYRVDSGEIYTYKVDPNTSVTIYDIEQEYGAGEDRLYTFKTWRDFVAAAQENEGLLVQPYTLTLKNGVVVKIEEKFYH